MIVPHYSSPSLITPHNTELSASFPSRKTIVLDMLQQNITQYKQQVRSIFKAYDIVRRKLKVLENHRKLTLRVKNLQLNTLNIVVKL